MAKTVLFKIWKFPQLTETFIVNQIVLTIKLGFEVKILAGELSLIDRNASIEIFKKYNLQDRIIIENYLVPPQKFKRIFKAIWLLTKNLFLVRSLLRYYNGSAKKGLMPLYEFFFYKLYRKLDIIHIQFGTNKHPVDVMKKMGYLTGRVIVSFHGHDLYFPINNRIPNNGYYNNLFETADYLIANTPFMRAKLIELDAPEKKIHVIPVGVDTTVFKPQKKRENKIKCRLITVGRLDDLKGQENGVRAINLLLKKGLAIEYIIVGSGVNKEKLTTLIEELGLSKDVKLIGRVSPDEVPGLLRSSDIFLMTSITSFEGMEESQGLVTAEAQACGLPVVAFDSGGIKYTLKNGETGFLCKEKDIECLASKIEELILDEELRKRMSENAVQFIEENYSEHSVLEKWRKIYA